ncbi:hypothetical protein ACT4UL_05190, partial [Bacillus sp. HC-TM]
MMKSYLFYMSKGSRVNVVLFIIYLTPLRLVYHLRKPLLPLLQLPLLFSSLISPYFLFHFL